jgi:ribonucleoside-diphosphate reductase alpha chain
MEVGAWVYKHFDEVSGVSFLPHSDHTYQQAPYQDIDKEKYNELKKLMPKSVDFEKLKNYENDDNTTGTQELACTAGSCEIVDITSQPAGI